MIKNTSNTPEMHASSQELKEKNEMLKNTMNSCVLQ